MMDRRLLAHLHETAEFQMLLTELRKLDVLVPLYDPSDPNSVEQWKVRSAEKRKFDSMMSVISPFKEVR